MVKTSDTEKRDLLKAWFVISLAFSIVYTGLHFNREFLFTFLISAITVGSGFLLHELAHKMIAQRYGCWAEFRADPLMLGVCLISSLFGFIFAAPGAVMIMGHVSTRKNGHISLAGPMVNLILAAFFYALAFLSLHPFLTTLGTMGFRINTWLCIFNMIPFGPLDGKKVWVWNKKVFFGVLGTALLLFFLP